ncbi:MAG: DNA repair protein RadA, partial [Bacteroidales bacterium]|nr:DNA repair protein RadA [Bacteroidales bacterium]
MASAKSIWFCTNCGNESPKWMGRCPACGEWNTMVEAPVEKKSAKGGAKAVASGSKSERKPLRLKEIDHSKEPRVQLSIPELDRLLGGGIVPGSLVLIGGEPGIGKSTLSLQIPLVSGLRTLYVTGEESARQVKMRADRLLSVPAGVSVS